MIAGLSAVLDEFHKDLGRTVELLNLITAFKDYSTSKAPSVVETGEEQWPEALTLLSAAPAVRTDLPVLSGSLLLYICGRFEYFIRELVVAVADDMASNVHRYEDLPSKVRDELQAGTLKVVQAPQRYNYAPAEAEAVLLKHAANLSSPPTLPVATVSIEARVLTLTDANMNASMLADLFKRLDIKDLWKELGKQARLKSHLGQAVDGACTTDAITYLDGLMKERNGIAHPTGMNTFPGVDRVLEAAAYLRVLSAVLVEIAQIPR